MALYGTAILLLLGAAKEVWMSITALHRSAARLRIGTNPKGLGWAAVGDRAGVTEQHIMTKALVFVFILSSPLVLAAEAFESAAESEIRELIHRELLGHYDIELVSLLEIKDHVGEWDGFQNGYGLKTVVARFAAVRNANWSRNLSRSVAENCGEVPSVYLLCQPTGHKFTGKVEVDLAFTKDGWKILSRNYRNMRAFSLSNYLLLDGNPKDGYVLPPKQPAR
jgi:hypothetical protein